MFNSITASQANNIFILAIGINKYLDPEISTLNSCIKDVYALAAYLKESFAIPEANYKILINEQATRANIITTFQKHFSNLKDGDIALLHFSGHGSWEYTSDAFEEAGFEPRGGRNELLVCHDSRINNIYSIADKELRLLISEMQYPKGESKNIQFVALLDCCHSGSMLRLDEKELKIRLASSRGIQRPLKDYLNGQYQKQLEQNGEIRLPPANYISITACAPEQSAIETSKGGVFTNAFIEALKLGRSGNHFPSYAELFTLIREIIKNNPYNDQTPYLEYAGQVNPFHNFLSQGEQRKADYPKLVKTASGWEISLGVIHGIPSSWYSDFQIPVFANRNFNTPVGFAQLTEVNLESSKLEVHFKNEGNLDSRLNYYAAVCGRKLPLRIRVTTPTAQAYQGRIRKELEKTKNIGYFEIRDLATYELRVGKEQYTLYRNEPIAGELILGVKSTGDLATQFMIYHLRRIAKWEQINNIQPPKYSAIKPTEVELFFIYTDYAGNVCEHSLTPEKDGKFIFQIPITFDQTQGATPYRLIVKNNSLTNIWLYLVHLDKKYGINQKNESFNKALYPSEIRELYNSANFNIGLGISNSKDEETLDIFLLFASAKELELPFIFEQKGLESNYGKILSSMDILQQNFSVNATRGDMRLKTFARASWTIRRLEIKMIRSKNC